MLGPLVNSAALVFGGFFGAALGRFIPVRVKEALPQICGIISGGIGAVLTNKVHAMPAVALALLAGTLIGELLLLERGLGLAVNWAKARIGQGLSNERENPLIDGFVVKYVTIIL